MVGIAGFALYKIFKAMYDGYTSDEPSNNRTYGGGGGGSPSDFELFIFDDMMDDWDD
jgi:hypothetical protein